MAWLLDVRLGHPVPKIFGNWSANLPILNVSGKRALPLTRWNSSTLDSMWKSYNSKKKQSSHLCWVLWTHVANINWWRGQSSELVVESGRKKNTCPQRCPTRCRQVMAARVSSDSWGEPCCTGDFRHAGLTAPENPTLDPFRTRRRFEMLAEPVPHDLHKFQPTRSYHLLKNWPPVHWWS